MENPTTVLLLLFSSLLLIYHHQAPAAGATLYTAPGDFIRSSCNVTLYPELCYTSLAGYASAVKQDPGHLALVAIRVSLSHARQTASYISNLKNSSPSVDPAAASALRDCCSTFGDAIYQIRGSLTQMRKLGRGYGSGSGSGSGYGYEAWRFQVSNVQTWMSAAMTYEETCLDGFDDVDEGSTVKSEVFPWVVEDKEFASNALALILEKLIHDTKSPFSCEVLFTYVVCNIEYLSRLVSSRLLKQLKPSAS
ncbi:hypothetical protein Dimus_014603 [Dionaea muscipula]